MLSRRIIRLCLCLSVNYEIGFLRIAAALWCGRCGKVFPFIHLLKVATLISRIVYENLLSQTTTVGNECLEWKRKNGTFTTLGRNGGCVIGPISMADVEDFEVFSTLALSSRLSSHSLHCLCCARSIRCVPYLHWMSDTRRADGGGGGGGGGSRWLIKWAANGPIFTLPWPKISQRARVNSCEITWPSNNVFISAARFFARSTNTVVGRCMCANTTPPILIGLFLYR